MSTKEKQQLPWHELEGMAEIAKEIDGMRASPEKEAMKAHYRETYDRVVEKYDVPLQETTSRGQEKLLHAIDYGSGLLRTGVGEVGLALAQPEGYRKEDAAWRGLKALNPFGRPALGIQDYLDLGGAGDMGSIADAEGNYRVTGKQALGFAGDTLLNPALLAGGLKALIGRGAKVPSYMQTRMPGAPAQTAATLEAVRDLEREGATGAGAKGFFQGAKDVAGAIPGIAIDPLTALKQALLKYRFSTADKAAAMKGKAVPSEIFAESGGKGITSEGIRADFRSTIDKHDRAIDDMINGLDPTNPRHTVRRGTPSEYNIADQRAMQENFDPLAVSPATGLPVEPTGHTMLYPLYEPKQAYREGLAASGKESRAVRRAMEDRVASAEIVNPGYQKQWLETQAAEGVPETAQGKAGGQYQLFKEPPEVKTSTRPPRAYVAREEISPGVLEEEHTQRPGKTVQTVNGERAVGQASGNWQQDVLDTDRQMSANELRDNRRAWQREADLGGLYANGKDKLAPRLPKDVRHVEAEAELAGRMSKHASRLEDRILDQAEPGMGGEAYLRKQDQSALFEGSPWLDRDPVSGATDRSTQAFNPLQARAIGLAKNWGNNASMLGYQALRQPVVRRGILPGARALWLENYWNNQLSPTYDEDPETGQKVPGGQNPWGLIRKYGVPTR